jgi:hypothetical protein
MNRAIPIKYCPAILGLLLSTQALALDSRFSYQGSLQDGGQPANGSYDLHFELQSQAGIPVADSLQIENVSVVAGVFTVQLDFGSAISSGDYQLQIGVRPGSSTGTHTMLLPPSKINPMPQAQVVGIAVEAVTVSPDSIDSTSVADFSLAAFDVDPTQIQRRVSGGCGPDQLVVSIAADGSVSCVSPPPGPTGPAGAMGASGPQGPAGPAGMVGPTGLAGPIGPPGPPGERGATGPQGASGPVGATGPSGPIGEAGAVGATGPVGAMGEPGLAGPAGPPGPVGPQGPTGPVGPDGSQGSTGPQGSLGPTGAIGLRGLTGPQGPQGATGATGATGPAGQAGAVGPVGLTGSYGPDFGGISAHDEDSGSSRNFAVTGGRLALLNSGNYDGSPDLQFVVGSDFSYFQVQTSGIYQLSYAITYRADASPDIERLDTYFTLSDSCSLSELENNTAGIARSSISMIDNEHRHYAARQTGIAGMSSGACIALKAIESSPAADNSAEMVRAIVSIVRLD